MRSSLVALPLILAVALFSGCMEGPAEGYTCDDGRKVGSLTDCLWSAPTSTQDVPKQLAECDKFSYIEDRNACYANVGIDSGDLSVCDKLTDRYWRYVCYKKLNMSSLITEPLETTTSTVEAITTSTFAPTTTTLACGNGMIDAGEECDIGSLCRDLDGICKIVKSPPNPDMSVCLSLGQCDWNAQEVAHGQYDMGSCIGCLGPNMTDGCKCLKANVMNKTHENTGDISIVSGETIKSGTHKVCSEGLCRNVDGVTDNECLTDGECRHHVCENFKCVLIRTPGTSSCEEDASCRA
jgi:hypothetical protein